MAEGYFSMLLRLDEDGKGGTEWIWDRTLTQGCSSTSSMRLASADWTPVGHAISLYLDVCTMGALMNLIPGYGFTRWCSN